MLAAPPACTIAAARAAILQAPSLHELAPTVENGGGPDAVICHDLTGDGVPELAVTVFSGGTAGDIAWVVFQRASGSWRVAYAQLKAYKVGLFRVGGNLVESQPIYRPNDPNCCPSGGFRHRRFHWTGTTFRVVRTWHDASFRS
jgi:hypothetical protein